MYIYVNILSSSYACSYGKKDKRTEYKNKDINNM
jgi:hypothetical protein